MSERSVLYPGTFDPITNGHADLVIRAAMIFDRVIVAIAKNTAKAPVFAWQERIELANTVLAEYSNVEIMGFDILLAEYAQQIGVHLIIRGLRAVSDFEYEFQLASLNRHIGAGLETIYMTPREEHAYISSSSIREIAGLGGDVSRFVHPCVQQALIGLRK